MRKGWVSSEGTGLLAGNCRSRLETRNPFLCSFGLGIWIGRVVILWAIFGSIWVGVAGLLYAYLGVPDAIMSLLLWPLGLIDWVNVQEHLPDRKDDKSMPWSGNNTD